MPSLQDCVCRLYARMVAAVQHCHARWMAPLFAPRLQPCAHCCSTGDGISIGRSARCSRSLPVDLAVIRFPKLRWDQAKNTHEKHFGALSARHGTLEAML
jgi:hypothetical protein